jgi:hypothetical protein
MAGCGKKTLPKEKGKRKTSDVSPGFKAMRGIK